MASYSQYRITVNGTSGQITNQYPGQQWERIAQEVKSMRKLRSKGHRDWKNATDEQIDNCARAIIDSLPSTFTRYTPAKG